MENLKNPRGLRFRPWQQKILSTMSCLNLCKDGRFWFWLWFWLYLLLLMLRLSLSSSSSSSSLSLLLSLSSHLFLFCCYGCCCFLTQMMMLPFIHSPVQRHATRGPVSSFVSLEGPETNLSTQGHKPSSALAEVTKGCRPRH